MGYLWFLKLALNCIDHLAWPLLAVGYPLCASVHAIETDSYSETRDLMSYWILLSLIYLFEYAFLRLLSWFQFWPYFKLMIIFWLIIPDFGRPSYVYNNLIRLCITVNPRAVISRLKNWRKLLVKKENFLLHAERYVQENGTEALEKLIASKITTHDIGAEATKTIRATDKKETQQITTQNIGAEATNTIRATAKKDTQQITTHNIGAEATNTIRATDKKETQQITTQNIGAEATNTIRATDKKETRQITTHNIGAEATNTIRAADKKETQQITTQNIGAEATNTIRATDKKDTQQTTTHNISVEATYMIGATDKKKTQQVITAHHIGAEATNTIRATDKKEKQKTNENKIQKEHKDIKDVEMIEKKEISAGKQDIPVMPNPSLIQNISSATTETNGMVKKGAAGGELPQSSTHKEVQKEWTCAVCQVTTSCEKNLMMHLNGRLHKATCEALNTKNQPSPQKMKNDQSKEELKLKNFTNQPNVEQKNIQFWLMKEQAQTRREHEKRMLSDPVKQSNFKSQKNNSTSDQKGVMMNNSKLRCEACNVSCTSEADLASHIKGKRHLAQIQTCSEVIYL